MRATSALNFFAEANLEDFVSAFKVRSVEETLLFTVSGAQATPPEVQALSLES